MHLVESYRKGVESDYEGGREAGDFVQFAKKVTGYVLMWSP